jgi:hypothetical protein
MHELKVSADRLGAEMLKLQLDVVQIIGFA